MSNNYVFTSPSFILLSCPTTCALFLNFLTDFITSSV